MRRLFGVLPPSLLSANRLHAFVWQVLALAAVALLIWFLLANTLANLSARNISTGFGFLAHEAGFAIGESLVAYHPSDSYGRAIWVGLVNTLRVAVLGIILATVLGTLIGIARLSKNWLITRLASVYVEVMRNVPLLLQLFFWYALITENMPGPRQAYHPLPGVFLSNRGLKIPALAGTGLGSILVGLAAAIIALVVLMHWARRRQIASGQTIALGRYSALLLLACPALSWTLAWALGGTSLTLSLPELRGFNFVGGITLSPEFIALLLGLVIYTSAFIAEVVRSGVQAVSIGQWEAAASLGLRRSLILRLVVLPQALRVIVPPMTSQYLNLSKNSSLAVAIGYPDIVSVVNTTLNQTGQAIEGILIIMAAYLTVSLTIAVLMNLYNHRIARMEP